MKKTSKTHQIQSAFGFAVATAVLAFATPRLAAGPIVAAGAGSYSTELPAGSKPLPQKIYKTPDVKGPTVTGQWWSSLLWQEFSSNLFAHPLGMVCTPEGLAVSFASPTDTRLVGDIEKLTKQKIELQGFEFEDDRPAGRINTGRRHWDEEDRGREKPASRSRFVPPPKVHDPFFDRPYEASAEPVSTTASPEQVLSSGRSISPNIKPKRNVAALFKTTEPG